MYEARRQRSSWARIKLSIVRKFMIFISEEMLSTHFACFRFAFRLSLSFVVELTSLFRLHYSVFNVRFSVNSSMRLINSLTLFAILYFVSISVLFSSTVLWLLSYSFLTQTLFSYSLGSTCQLGGFLTDKNYHIASKFYVNTFVKIFFTFLKNFSKKKPKPNKNG